MKISYLEYQKFLARYYADLFTPQRLGQAFCNEFHIPAAYDRLFYETNNEVSKAVILECFVEQNICDHM